MAKFNANDYVVDGESTELVLQGAFKEWLIISDNQVYIIKKGFMTGHTFGDGVFKLPYDKIASVRVEFHLMTGLFEVSNGGDQVTNRSIWTQNKQNASNTAPNTITLKKAVKKDFEQACDLINKKISEAKDQQSAPTIQAASSEADELLKFKQLLDTGVINQAEFDAKKKQLLGI